MVESNLLMNLLLFMKLKKKKLKNPKIGKTPIHLLFPNVIWFTNFPRKKKKEASIKFDNLKRLIVNFIKYKKVVL